MQGNFNKNNILLLRLTLFVISATIFLPILRSSFIGFDLVVYFRVIIAAVAIIPILFFLMWSHQFQSSKKMIKTMIVVFAVFWVVYSFSSLVINNIPLYAIIYTMLTFLPFLGILISVDYLKQDERYRYKLILGIARIFLLLSVLTILDSYNKRKSQHRA